MKKAERVNHLAMTQGCRESTATSAITA